MGASQHWCFANIEQEYTLKCAQHMQQAHVAVVSGKLQGLASVAQHEAVPVSMRLTSYLMQSTWYKLNVQTCLHNNSYVKRGRLECVTAEHCQSGYAEACEVTLTITLIG